MITDINVTAVVMFLIFISATLAITYWASKRTQTASQYYAAGGKINPNCKNNEICVE